MNVSSKGIVLQTIKYSDSKRIIHVFTEKSGKVSFFQNIGKTQKGRSLRNTFIPLNIVDLEYVFFENKNFQRLKDYTIAYPYTNIPFNDIKRSVCLFLSEIIQKSITESSVNEQLFTFIENALKYYDLIPEKYSNFHLWFLLQLSKHLGFAPLSTFVINSYFDMLEGVFVPFQPNHSFYLQPEKSEIFNKLLKTSIDDYHLINLPRILRNEILHDLVAYYKIHIQSVKEIKSLEILEEVYK